jgi:hypothetical protein
MGEAYRIAKLGDARRKQAHPRCSSMLAGLKDVEEVFFERRRRACAAQPQHEFQLRRRRVVIMGIRAWPCPARLAHLPVWSGALCAALGRSDELAHSSLRMT